MKNKNLGSTEAKLMQGSLKLLKIQELEERLEVSALLPGGADTGANFFDFENCCNDKCNGNNIVMDDPVDTGEIGGWDD